MGTTKRYRDESDKKGNRKSKEDKREGSLDPGLKTRAAATRPGQWHTSGGGTKSRSYRGK